MPIRTNRGRAAVYRRLWGWPLRSPRHLMATFVGVAVVAIALAVITANAKGTAHHPAGTDTVLGTSSNSAPGDAGQPTDLSPAGGPAGESGSTITATRLASPPETPSSAPPAPGALAVIAQWGRLWVNHPVGLTTAQWLDQLRPFTTDEFFSGPLKTVDVANVTATEVMGDPSVIHSYTASVEAMVPTNAAPLYIEAVLTPDRGWLVSWYGPEPQ